MRLNHDALPQRRSTLTPRLRRWNCVLAAAAFYGAIGYMAWTGTWRTIGALL
jgi:hypothetical protein